MGSPLVERVDFKVDTSRHRSRSKMRARIRHMLAVASGMFPLMATFVFVRALFFLPEERPKFYHLAIVFLACGMVSLLGYAWTRAEKMRRREISARNRELKYRQREDRFQQDAARREARSAVLPPKEG